MSQTLLYLHALINFLIVVRIATYYPIKGSHKNSPASLLACIIALAAGSVTLRILTNTYLVPVDPAEIFFNALILVALIAARGNVSTLIKTIQRKPPYVPSPSLKNR